MWPDNGIKSSPNVSKSYPRSSRISFYKRVRFFKIAKKVPIIWATFDRNFVTNNYQKSPNLVTLWPINAYLVPSGQSYKSPTIVFYVSRVVIYARRGFMILVTGLPGGHRRGLTIKMSWVWIPASDTWCILITFLVVKLYCLKRAFWNVLLYWLLLSLKVL